MHYWALFLTSCWFVSRREALRSGLAKPHLSFTEPAQGKDHPQGEMKEAGRDQPVTTVALRASTAVGCVSCNHQWMSILGVVAWLCPPSQNAVLGVNVPLCAKATALGNSHTWVLESSASLELCDRCTAPVWARCFPTAGAGAPPCLQTQQSQHTAKPASFLCSPRSWRTTTTVPRKIRFFPELLFAVIKSKEWSAWRVTFLENASAPPCPCHPAIT